MKKYCFGMQKANIINKKVELFDYMEREEIGLATISETWLKPNKSIKSIYYNVYRKDRANENHSGVAIFVPKSIRHCLLPSLDETLQIKIFCNNNTSLTIVGVYFRGGSYNKNLGKEFENDLKKFNRIGGKNYIIMNDFNCRHTNWNCLKNNKWGIILKNMLTTNNYSLLFPATSTYIAKSSRGNPSTLDLIL